MGDKIKKVVGRGLFVFWCPGCECAHYFNNMWSFDNNYKEPTVSPSIRVTHGDGRVCHFFIKKGKIEYCGNCHHKFVGETVDMEDI